MLFTDFTYDTKLHRNVASTVQFQKAKEKCICSEIITNPNNPNAHKKKQVKVTVSTDKHKVGSLCLMELVHHNRSLSI